MSNLFKNRCTVTEAECWLWQGASNDAGYGIINFEGKLQVAHRVAWQHFRGPIPEGTKVLHTCDNKPCVNPAHLFLGSQSDNMVDCVRKGRHVQAVLTVADVEVIKIDRRASHFVAKDFGVSSSTIRKIRNGYNWKHV